MTEILTLIVIFAVALFASSYGTLTGGSSLLTIPILIFFGLNPSTAIATSRVGSLGLPISGLYKFHQKGFIDYKIGWIVGIGALFGALIGANLILQLNEEFIKKMVVFFTIAILILIILNPEKGIKPIIKKISLNHYIIGGIISFFIGIYGGLYGAGAGTFFSYLLILLFGQTMIQSAATRKIAGFLFIGMASIIFIYKGVVVFPIAIAIFLGCLIGSYLGASYSDKIGNVWIKRAFVGVVFVMSLRLLF